LRLFNAMKIADHTRRIVKSVFAHCYSQVITVITQLAGVPIFLHSWTLSKYGEWLVISAFAVYLSMADFGLLPAVGNRLVSDVQSGRIDSANAMLHSAISFIARVIVAVAAITGVLLVFVNVGVSVTIDGKLAIFFLVLSSCGAVFCGLYDSVFRAHGDYALITTLLTTIRLLEWGGAIIGVIAGGQLHYAALGFLLGRIGGTLIILIYAIRRYPKVKWHFRRNYRAEILSIGRPALGFLAFPMAAAINLQGMTILVATLLGPAAAAIFASYRTLSRVVAQLPTLVGKSIWPELSRAYAEGRTDRISAIYRVGGISTALIGLIVSVIIFVCGPWIITIWTHGRVPTSPIVLAGLLISSCAAAGTQVPMSLLGATNNHIVFSKIYVIATIFGLGLCAILMKFFNLNGAALGLAISDLAIASMSVFSGGKAIQLIRKNSRSHSISV
jgi:O-antigen/teichoic acid export membrane protein